MRQSLRFIFFSSASVAIGFSGTPLHCSEKGRRAQGLAPGLAMCSYLAICEFAVLTLMAIGEFGAPCKNKKKKGKERKEGIKMHCLS